MDTELSVLELDDKREVGELITSRFKQVCQYSTVKVVGDVDAGWTSTSNK